MSRFELQHAGAMAQQTRRIASTTGRKIGSSVPKGPRGAPHPGCEAVAGKSALVAMN